ncbi:MAG: helical backbone metal receptor [Pseudomonadota bacterium]
MKTAAKILVFILIMTALCGCRGKSGMPGGDGGAKNNKEPRYVSMVPSTTEILFELGEGHRVVGVCDQCLWPEPAAGLTKLGSYLNPSTEMMLKLKPDIAFLYKTQSHLVTALEERGIQVVRVRTENLEDLYKTIGAIGQATGRSERAAAMIDTIKAQLEKIAEATASGSGRVKTVVVADRMPFSLQRIFVATDENYLGQLVDIAGGDNCFEEMKVWYPMVAFEAIAACRPEVIIDLRPATQCTDEGIEKAEALWKASGIVYPEGTAKIIKVLGTDPVTVPGPRVVESANIFYGIIHGE